MSTRNEKIAMRIAPQIAVHQNSSIVKWLEMPSVICSRNALTRIERDRTSTPSAGT